MKRHGFTLIELLIVVAIIAILAAIAVPNFLEAQTRSRVSRVQNDLRTISLGMESYRVDNNSYPSWCPQNRDYFNRGDIVNGAYTVASYDAPFTNLLTTPITYMNSIPPDVFRMIANASKGDYVMYAVAYSPRTAAPGYYRHFKMYPRTGWMTWSWGPDQVNNSNYVSQPQVLANEAKATPDIGKDVNGYYISGTGSGKGIRYDPTNGTVSWGDIYRFGGDSITRLN
ncbi:MAG: prepilin-type N-terminal cleavage/methylation domain-containing protein [Candidatus Sumerlaeia bacterium]